MILFLGEFINSTIFVKHLQVLCTVLIYVSIGKNKKRPLFYGLYLIVARKGQQTNSKQSLKQEEK